MTDQPAPESLHDAGKTLWDSVVATYELNAAELRTLEDACGATDMLTALLTEWEEQGRPYISKGSMGQEVEHPLIGSIDKQRKARQAFLKQLALPDDPAAGADAAGERSSAARSMANARWSKRGA
jgi:hypothetical protein